MKTSLVLTFAAALLAGPVLANAANPPTEQEEANALCEKTWKNTTHQDDKLVKEIMVNSCNKNVKSKKHWECVANLVAKGNSVTFSGGEGQCPMK